MALWHGKVQTGASIHLARATVSTSATERLRRQNSNTAAAAHEADKVVIETQYRRNQGGGACCRKPVYRCALMMTACASLRRDRQSPYGDPGKPGDTVPKPEPLSDGTKANYSALDR